MEWNIVWENLPKLTDGLWVTLGITALSLVIGLCMAIPLALARLSRFKVLNWPAYVFILYFRGTPLLVQLVLVYHGIGQFRHELADFGLWSYFREAYFCGVLTLTLNTCAYTAEIFRGAIQSVPTGQIEAARSMGMSGLLLFRRITLPNAFRLAWPAYGNEAVFLMQASSLVSVITLLDLTGVAQRIISKTFAVYELYIAIAVIYLMITYLIISIFKIFENRMMRHQRAMES